MDDFEKTMTNVLSKEIYVPKEIEDTIKNSLNNKTKQPNFIKYKIIAIISSIIIAISGVAYAGYRIYKNVFNDREGIETAIEQGYISNEIGEYIESNDVFVKIKNSLMNDKNLDINFDILLKNRNIQDIKSIEFEKLLIVDEENNILYSNNISQLDTYISDNNLNITIGNFNDNYFNSGSSVKIRNTYSDSIEMIYNIASDNNYPTSKEIKIYAKNIIIKNSNSSEILNGDWTINEKLPEIFQDRQAYKYHLVTPNEDIISAELVVYNTETTINLTIKTSDGENKKLNDELSDLLIQNNNAKLQNNINLERELTNEVITLENNLSHPVSKVFIKNESEELFGITNSETVHGVSYRPIDKDYLTYSDTLDFNLYNSTKTIQLNFVYNGKEYSLEFKRLK